MKGPTMHTDPRITRPDGTSYPAPVYVVTGGRHHQPNHLLHAILSVITGGAWLVPWAFITWRAGRRG